VEKESTIFIYEKFLGNNSFFKNADKLEIHSLEKTKVKEYNINRWFRIRTGLGAGIKDNILAVEVDINTLPEKPVDFEIEKIRNFYITFFAFAKESFLNCFGVPL
jgi:hypothetical protein